MERIQIKNFKGFSGEGIDIDLQGRKNLLLCGENGSGKTSLFEALKMVFYKDRMLHIDPTIIGPEKEALIQQGIMNFSNMSGGQAFEIKVNGVDYNSFPSQDYDAFFISYADVKQNEDLSLDRILDEVYFGDQARNNVVKFWTPDFTNKINEILKDQFFEDVSVEINQGKGHGFRLANKAKSLTAAEDLYDCFNEAIVHLAALIILLNIVSEAADPSKKRILVLDDVITSLDYGNRSLVMNYILREFDGFQCFVLTHNVSFYNLFKYEVNIRHCQRPWLKASLYLINGAPGIYEEKDTSLKNAEQLWDEYKALAKGGSVDSLCNDIRKRYELLIYEFSRVVQYGDYEETKKMLQDVYTKPDPQIYLSVNPQNHKLKNVYDMVDEIRKELHSTNGSNKVENITKTIEAYSIKGGANGILEILNNMKIFQKVILHPMSHGRRGGVPSYSDKEIRASLLLLERLESVVSTANNTQNGGNVIDV